MKNFLKRNFIAILFNVLTAILLFIISCALIISATSVGIFITILMTVCMLLVNFLFYLSIF